GCLGCGQQETLKTNNNNNNNNTTNSTLIEREEVTEAQWSTPVILGSSVVEGEFKITNQNFWSGLEDPTSEEYRSMAKSIENELDVLFLGSVWSREYNHSRVTSLSKGSLLVRARLLLNTADVAAAQKLGTAFLRGLHNRHGHEWLGQYSVDITSIRFTEVLVDTPPSSTSPTPPISVSTSPQSPTSESSTAAMEVASKTPTHNVGWGEWTSWSTCSPCSPQYDQMRTRVCRLDDGKGLLLNTIEPCLSSSQAGGRQLQSTGGDMETRPCRCHPTPRTTTSTSSTTSTTTTSTTTTSTTTTPTPWREEQPQQEEELTTKFVCDTCLSGEVCVGLQGDPYPTCRTARDPADRTGCGGLCAIDSEVCQALGSRAFQCHSASLCLGDEWRCADGLCIPLIKRCDGHMNCYDQSDEQHCRCGPGKFQCGNNTSCLAVTAKCDGKMDCWDGSDEANCTNSSVSPSTSSATAWRTVPTAAMNPLAVPEAASPTNIGAGLGDASQLPGSVVVGTRVGTGVMNRTAIGLSSLSHRERELLS
ncbi:hypothetical protein Pmani_036609, partial [Petrolisthes manimaculis]